MSDVLTIEPEGAPEPVVRLAEFVWPGDSWDTALHALADGGRRVARSRVRDQRRELVHYEWKNGALRALDQTIFYLDSGRFVEAERYRTRNGPNLHTTPPNLPAVLRLGVPTPMLPGVLVTAGWIGGVMLRLGDWTERARAVRLDVAAVGPEVGGVAAEQHDRGRQWLVEGVGEVALRMGGGAEPESPGRAWEWDRWLIAWTGGGRTCVGALPSGLSGTGWPDLPDRLDPSGR